MSVDAAWDSLLVELRRDLELAEQAVATGTIHVATPFAPPSGLGPPPLECVADLRDLAERYAALTSTVAAIPSPDADTRRFRSPNRTGGRFEVRA